MSPTNRLVGGQLADYTAGATLRQRRVRLMEKSVVTVVEPGISASEIEVRGRERVIRKARELFLTQGYAAVSMQQIADAVGVNKATLYHYFRDKQALFIAVMVEQGKQVNAAVGAALAAGETLQEKMQSVAQTILDMQHSDFGRLSSDMHHHVSEEGRIAVYAQCGVPWAQISDVLRDAAARGELRSIDPDLASRGFFGMIISQRWQKIPIGGDTYPETELARALADLFLFGILKVAENAATPASAGDPPRTPA
jgi:AcrR family transcriptional regulator